MPPYGARRWYNTDYRKKAMRGVFADNTAVEKQTAPVGAFGTEFDIVRHHKNTDTAFFQGAHKRRKRPFKGRVKSLWSARPVTESPAPERSSLANAAFCRSPPERSYGCRSSSVSRPNRRTVSSYFACPSSERMSATERRSSLTFLPKNRSSGSWGSSAVFCRLSSPNRERAFSCRKARQAPWIFRLRLHQPKRISHLHIA